MDEDGVNTLFRLVDTVNFSMPNSFSATMGHAPAQSDVRLPLQISLLTRWGGPEGEYTERITMIDLHHEERDMEQEVRFTLQGGHHFAQIRHFINMQVRAESGVRWFRIYLNAQWFVDVPLQINVSLADENT